MQTRIYAAALATSLVFGATGFVMAQATPPVGDPTANSATTPKQKVESGSQPSTSTSTSTQTTGAGAGAATSGGGTAPSGAATTK